MDSRLLIARHWLPQLYLFEYKSCTFYSRRQFHDYFVTHLPSSSLHPDSRSAGGPHHKLPRSASKPHTPKSKDPSPAPLVGVTRDTTVVRIPLRSAKHHFGVSVSRGTRPYNEDAYQAGVIELPAFAKRAPVSLTRAPTSSPLQAFRERRQQEQQQRNPEDAEGEATSAEGASGDPQVFYFGVFDGHGGTVCSDFLKESLHSYIEETATEFDLKSSLRASQPKDGVSDRSKAIRNNPAEQTVPQEASVARALSLQSSLIKEWRNTVGGYFRRFKPAAFLDSDNPTAVTISNVLTYSFLRADLDFVTAQARKSGSESDPVLSDAAINASDDLNSPLRQIGGPKRFKGGSTCSVALISTPSPTPFWHPASPSTLVTSHVGDTRILLCRTRNGEAVRLTMDHHPDNPIEGERLRKYAASFVTDSFGEERMSGLANTRAFGDMASKRQGVSAEPEIRRIELNPAEYSFLVLVSDGISGTLSDQEVVDIVKEAKTPEQGSRDVVSFATEVSVEGDNATCLVVRLGGWERRSEGGLGSMGTREARDWRKQEAANPRSRQT
ncbi:MAG: hypothetical protein MMC33_009676 [Icmadophila ericetorum]|nr:hypothetical protein [Icmadophila ericetorum]